MIGPTLSAGGPVSILSFSRRDRTPEEVRKGVVWKTRICHCLSRLCRPSAPDTRIRVKVPSLPMGFRLCSFRSLPPHRLRSNSTVEFMTPSSPLRPLPSFFIKGLHYLLFSLEKISQLHVSYSSPRILTFPEISSGWMKLAIKMQTPVSGSPKHLVNLYVYYSSFHHTSSEN